MTPRLLLAALSLALGVALLPSAPARAAAPALTVTAPSQYADEPVTVTARLAADGVPTAGVPLTLERWDGAAWTPLASAPTDAEGRLRADLVVSRDPARNRLRARSGGSEGLEALGEAPLLQRPALAGLAGPTRLVDETSGVLTAAWTTTAGVPVDGPVALQRWVRTTWLTEATAVTGPTGRVDIAIRPRVDARYRVLALGTPWAASAASGVHAVDNVAPGRPVRLPRRAPGPRKRLAPQPRATTPGADVRITTIPDDVWADMVGRTWRKGCPVGRSSLRLLRINYWDFSGYRRRGELVANVRAVRQMAGALADMYAAGLPIRSMRRVDRFGYSKALRGGDDHDSMAAGNTSAFNCRWVVGRPGVRSPHTYGYALDVNTWENPFRSRRGWTPNRWWVGHSDSRVAWRSRQHRVVRIMARHGLRWTYGVSDAQHFDVVRGRGARPIPGEVPPECRVAALCH